MTATPGKVITTAIIDDEPLARENVRLLLAGYPEFSIVGEAADGASALALLQRAWPALVFLDVKMPLGGGFDVLARLQAGGATEMPFVIFVTAFDEFALRAFEACALDYLLKPIDDRRFATALERAKQRLRERASAGLDERIRSALAMFAGLASTERARGPIPPFEPALQPSRLMARQNGRTRLIRVDDVAWVEADSVHVLIHTTNGVSRTRGSLIGIAAQLGASSFVRVHRRALVNVEFIRGVRDLRFGDGLIVLRTGETVRFSRRWRAELERAMLGPGTSAGQSRG